MRTLNTGVVSSIPSCVTYKTPLVRKATGNHLIKSAPLEKAQGPVSDFDYARNRECNAVRKAVESVICLRRSTNKEIPQFHLSVVWGDE